ncbi:MAG: photosystem II complex extrinsic protein PsbU [Xenococcus sp. (in: cyanobacteria)]
MKRLVSIFAILLLVIGSWGFSGVTTAEAADFSIFSLQTSPILAARRNAADDKLSEIQGKVDLNNSDVRDFRNLRGFYPTLAGKIIKYAPYNEIEDVLEIPGLSETQLKRLQANLDNFVVTDPSLVFNAGDDRINPGVY